MIKQIEHSIIGLCGHQRYKTQTGKSKILYTHLDDCSLSLLYYHKKDKRINEKPEAILDNDCII
jgi:hypothetical protein